MRLSNRVTTFSATSRFLLVGLAVVMLLAAASGCSPDRKGTPAANRAPEVFIVNTPPDGATFSRNPDLNWYATDGDGFIAFFRYGVVVDSNLKINGQPVSVETFVEQATDLQFGWDTLLVNLDHPQSTATVRLYANIDFPIDSFVTQYFFIQAQDDMGAKSGIVWRRYARNDHYPNTHFRASELYINARDENSPAPGIKLNWDGADSTDWGRTKPPLEFEWRLYGPFEANAPIYVNIVKEDCVWDPGTQTYINCTDTKVLDLDALPPVVGGVPQPLAHSKGPKFSVDPTDVWVTDLQTSIYNVFKDVPNLTKTSQFKFIFWVRARDDGFVPDPTPAFSQFLVVEAMFEKSLAVFDLTAFKTASFWFPRSLALEKALYYNYVNTTLERIYGAGYTKFDTITTTDTFAYPPSVKTWETDYFHTNTIPKNPISPQTTIPKMKPAMTDILSHKVILVINDVADGVLQENVDLEGLIGYAYLGMNMGASGWYMGRNTGTTNMNQNTEPGNYPLSTTFGTYFGFQQITHEGWTYMSLRRVAILHAKPIWNEQFVGAYSLAPEVFPDIDIDTNLILSRYRVLSDSMFLPSVNVDTHYFSGLPEVGAGTRTNTASALYLYKSRFGDASNLNGKVMGVAQDVDGMRSLSFLFTPLSVPDDQANNLFYVSMNWLMDKFLRAEGSPKPAMNYAGENTAVRRARITQILKEIEEAGERDPQILTDLKIALPPEIEVPTNIIITP